MRHKKKLLSFSGGRRIVAIMLVFAMCMTLSGFRTLATYGADPDDTETVSEPVGDGTADTALVGEGADEDGEDPDVNAPDDDNASVISDVPDDESDGGENGSAEEEDAYSGEDADDSADTEPEGEDSLISPRSVDDDDPEEDGDIEDDWEDYEGESDVYWVDWDFDYENETDRYLRQNETREFSLHLYCLDWDENDERYYEEEIEDFDLAAESENPDVLEVEADGSVVRVTGLGESSSAWISLTVSLYDGTVVYDEAYEACFYVSNDYLVLTCDDVDNVELGEIFDPSEIEWTHTRYYVEEGALKEEEVNQSKYSVRLVWAGSSCWKNEDESADLPGLTRISVYDTLLSFVAEVDGENVASRTIYFDRLDNFYYLDHERDYLLAGESMDIAIVGDPGEFPEGMAISWEVFEYNEDGDEVNTGAATLQVDESDQTRATLTANEGYNGTEVYVRATLEFEGMWIDEPTTWIDIWDSYDSLEECVILTYFEKEDGSIVDDMPLFPGDSLQLISSLRRSTIYDSELMEDVEFTYRLYENEYYPGLLSVTEDGWVTVADNVPVDEYEYFVVTITATFERSDGTEGEYSQDMWLCVTTSEYESCEADTLYLEPGDTVSIEDVKAYIVQYSQDGSKERISDLPVVAFSSSWTTDDTLVISDDETVLTIPEDIVIEDGSYITSVYAFAEDEDGFFQSVIVRIEVSDHEHIWDEGVVTKEPTCTDTGVVTYTCTKCGETKTELISGGHTLKHYGRVEPTTTSDGNVEYWYCEVCGRYFSDAEAKNEISASAIILSATKDPADGQAIETGSATGTSSTGSMDSGADTDSTGSATGTSSTGSTDSGADTDSTGTTSDADTGDQSMIFLWLVIMAGAFGTLFTATAKRRRSR